MATYIPNITDVFPEPVVYTPDFNFFDKMLQRKQSMYDQGVSQAKSAFNSVLNTPLSDKANIPLRDEYIKNAKESLKSISGSDFSLPENVQAAQNIFSPFWNDDLMLKDAGLTKWYQSQAQKLKSWRDDNDPKTKEQYNGIAMMYLNNGLEKLQGANRDASVYDKVEKREAIPFANIQGWLEEQAGKDPDKLKVVWDEQSPDGAYLISSINGERSKQKFTTWAQSRMGNNFNEQFRVTGIVEKEQRIKDLRKTMPNMTDEQALQTISQDVVNDLDQGYRKRKNDIDVEMANINGMLKAMPPVLDDNHKKLVDGLKDNLIQLNGRLSSLDEKYKYFNQTDKSKIAQAVLTNPDIYFGTLAEQRLVENWATGRASIESKTVKENTAFFSAQNIEMRKAEFNRNVKNDEWQKQKDIWDQQGKEWDRLHPKATGTKTTTVTTDAFGNTVTTSATTDGEDPISTGRYIGLGTTGDITKSVLTADQVYKSRMKDLFVGAHNLIFDPKGLLYLAKAGLGLTDGDLSSVSSAFKNEVAANYDPNSPDYDFTADQKISSEKLKKALEADQSVKDAGIKITGPENMKNALIVYAHSYFNKRLELSKDGNDIPLNQNEFGAMMNYMTAVQNLDVYQANEANRQETLKKLLKNPDYNSIAIDRNGEKELIDANYLANNEFKNLSGKLLLNTNVSLAPSANAIGNLIGLVGVNVPTIAKDLTAKKLADAYINGDLKINYTSSQNSPGAQRAGGGPDQATIEYEDKTYTVPKELVPSISGILTKYGSSEQLFDKIKKANDLVVPDLLFYKDQTGRLGTEFSYTFDKKHQEDKAFNILNEALSPANGDIYGADGKPVDAETMGALRALIQNKEENAEKYLQGFTYKTLGVEGKPTISFNIGEISSETKQQIGNVNLDKLNQQQYSIAILPTATGPTLTSLPNNTGMYVYQNLLRGKPMHSDPIISASGFDFTLTPNTDGSTGAGGQVNTPTRVTLNLKYNIRENNTDPKTNQLTSTVKSKASDIDFDLAGPNSKSPDEIVNYLYQLYYQTMVQNRDNQQQYQKFLQSNPNGTNANGTPLTYDRDAYYRNNGIIIK